MHDAIEVFFGQGIGRTSEGKRHLGAALMIEVQTFTM